MRLSPAIAAILLLAGCSTTSDKPAPAKAKPVDSASVSPPASIKTKDSTLVPKGGAPKLDGPQGTVEADISNVLGKPLPARIAFVCLDEDAHIDIQVLDAPQGKATGTVPAGRYRAYVHIYEGGLSILADAKDITVSAAAPVFLPVNILEGASGSLNLRDFDTDGDLALDRVEVALGTNREDASSIPGQATLTWDNHVVRPGARWYRGELHARSQYGGGTEGVSDLVSRAEKAGLDFLAITDRHSLEAARDPGFRSSKLALIPAMEWGTEDHGLALLYAPRTLPGLPGSVADAQSECLRVQAQGGAYAIANPCMTTSPWQWGLSYVNAVEVWSRGWREAPPLALEQLRAEWKERHNGKLVYSIAAAAADYDAATEGAAKAGVPYQAISGNMQSTRFWDYETARGLVAAAIGGSNSSSPKVPLGAPVTYIYAENLSLPALLEGIRYGRTYVSSGVNGPSLQFTADVFNNGSADAGIGGTVPLKVDTKFEVIVANAEGKKLQVLENGRPIISKPIEGNGYVHRFVRHPSVYSVYRVQVVGTPANPSTGFGPLEVYAISSPIFAQDVAPELLNQSTKTDPNKIGIRLKGDRVVEIDQFPNDSPPLELK